MEEKGRAGQELDRWSRDKGQACICRARRRPDEQEEVRPPGPMDWGHTKEKKKKKTLALGISQTWVHSKMDS